MQKRINSSPKQCLESFKCDCFVFAKQRSEVIAFSKCNDCASQHDIKLEESICSDSEESHDKVMEVNRTRSRQFPVW